MTELHRAIESATGVAPQHQRLIIDGNVIHPPEPLRVLRKRLATLQSQPSRTAANEAAAGRLQGLIETYGQLGNVLGAATSDEGLFQQSQKWGALLKMSVRV
eukprot:SAG31_NODE_18597_length_630_cov_0.875706_1_plen_101_part_10